MGGRACLILAVALAAACAPDALVVDLGARPAGERTALLRVSGGVAREARIFPSEGPWPRLAADVGDELVLTHWPVDALRRASGAPLGPEDWSRVEVSVGPAASGGCGRCLAPSPAAPLTLFPGDRCAPPPWALGEAFRVGPSGLEPVPAEDRRLATLAFDALRIGLEGECPVPAEPVAENPVRAELCPLGRGSDALGVWHLGVDETGAAIALGSAAVAAVDAQRAELRSVELALREVLAIVPWPGAPGSFLVVSRTRLGSETGAELLRFDGTELRWRRGFDGRQQVQGAWFEPGGERIQLVGVTGVLQRPAGWSCALVDGAIGLCRDVPVETDDRCPARARPEGIQFTVPVAGGLLGFTSVGASFALPDGGTQWLCNPDQTDWIVPIEGLRQPILGVGALGRIDDRVFACGTTRELFDNPQGPSVVVTATVPALQRDAGGRLVPRSFGPVLTATGAVGARCVGPLSVPGGDGVGFLLDHPDQPVLVELGADGRTTARFEGRASISARLGAPPGRVSIVDAGGHRAALTEDGALSLGRAGGALDMRLEPPSTGAVVQALVPDGAGGFLRLDPAGVAWAVPAIGADGACPEARRTQITGIEGTPVAAVAVGPGRAWVSTAAPDALLEVSIGEGRAARLGDAPPMRRLAWLGEGRAIGLDGGGRVWALGPDTAERLESKTMETISAVDGVGWALGREGLGRVTSGAEGLRLEPIDVVSDDFDRGDGVVALGPDLVALSGTSRFSLVEQVWLGRVSRDGRSVALSAFPGYDARLGDDDAAEAAETLWGVAVDRQAAVLLFSGGHQVGGTIRGFGHPRRSTAFWPVTAVATQGADFVLGGRYGRWLLGRARRTSP